MRSFVVHKTGGEKSDGSVEPVGICNDDSVTEISSVNSGDLCSHKAKNNPVMDISFSIEL
jgi:hypothetical protein